MKMKPAISSTKFIFQIFDLRRRCWYNSKNPMGSCSLLMLIEWTLKTGIDAIKLSKFNHLGMKMKPAISSTKFIFQIFDLRHRCWYNSKNPTGSCSVLILLLYLYLCRIWINKCLSSFIIGHFFVLSHCDAVNISRTLFFPSLASFLFSFF